MSPLVIFMLVIQLCTLVHSSPAFSSKIDDAVLNDICNRTGDPSPCQKVLKSNPKFATADLPGVCQIAIDMAHSNVARVYKRLPSLINNQTNPLNYMACVDGYDGAIGGLEDAASYLKSGDNNGVNIAASSALTYVVDCEDSFSDPPSEIPPKLAVAMKNFNVVCGIILVVSNLLPK